ncbi:MAG: ABC transporter permease [Gammaproteobacteria bacterium]|nr:ABC transporter permease [Gammaproteobacteria bacterium]NIR91350.1 ABC transporter permease [Gammaproteobacteria bacterium]
MTVIRLQALLAKEFRQLLRDPRMRFFVIVPPLVQLVVFGFAATFDVRAADIGVVDTARTQETRELVAAIAAGGRYRAGQYADMRSAAVGMQRGDIRAIVHFDTDFEDERAVQLVADGSDSNSAQLVLGQLIGYIREHERISTGFRPAVELEERAWYNPNLDDRQYFVPGIIANVVLIATLTLAAMTVVRERELGTLERLMVTPIGRLEFLVGKLVPVACVGLFDVVLVSAIAVFGLDVPFRGSFAALMAGSVLFLMSTLGLGLLISSYSTTQQQAVLLAVFFIMPAVLLSGFAFPIANMPETVQIVTYLDPLRYFLVVIRDVFLKGAGVGEHLREYAMMALLGGAALGLSSLRVR